MLRRGLLKYYLLKLLSEEPQTGYGLIKRIEEETGVWKPSTGSIYPLLQLLEEKGLLSHDGENERKVYRLTGTGETALSQAHEAKDELLRSLMCSCQVFGRIFGEEDGEDVESLQAHLRSWFDEAGSGAASIPRGLRARLFLLRQMFLALPYQELSEEQMERLQQVIEDTLLQLDEFAQ